MRLAIVVLVALAVFQSVYGDADPCLSDKCAIADNCRCSSINGPLAIADTPQLIVLAFIDGAKEEIYKEIWAPLVEPRKNPDEEFITATFYVPHLYSDYQIVHDLASNGFEIGVHSVTNEIDQEYWLNATQATLEDEFGTQKKILAKFANIPEEYITGTLTPQLKLAGDNSINAFAAQGFVYDNSWPSRTSLYPYTLDYASDQGCDIGALCPKNSHKGFWISPIVDLTSEDGDVCASLFACFRSRYNQSAQEISDWLVNEVQAIKKLNRAPITLIIDQNLFTTVVNSYKGLTDALDKIQEDKDVFLVSQARVIEWIKNPVPISEFKTSAVAIETGCVKSSCNYPNPGGEERYMVACVPCPKNYPWLGNPDGN